ncbi:hypothetical protein PFTANZ_04271 [Plasmodium falciparum Tanzania (2000708)]|uniref:MORN repeat protein n=1 Tax=Plasmodium falciparum Tanzania (2000708) TaxID=1036725 RepID=A0A024W379_PLAFA|nr:hypothetical protein PFTANZ_04271 [Plasmodium falciparum Tanzania (2000708)]
MIRKRSILYIITYICTNIYHCIKNEINYEYNSELNKIKNPFLIDIENKEECNFKYDNLKTLFKYIYLIECSTNSNKLQLHFINIAKKNNKKKDIYYFYNENDKKIKSDIIQFDVEKNDKKVNYKVCPTFDKHKKNHCFYISIIIIFQTKQINGLRELFINHILLNKEDHPIIADLLYSNNIKIIDNKLKYPVFFLVHKNKIKRYHVIDIKIERYVPSYIYASSYIYNFVFIDKNKNNLLKEENYIYESYFYKFYCTNDNMNIYVSTCDKEKKQFYIYKINIYCYRTYKSYLNNIYHINIVEVEDKINNPYLYNNEKDINNIKVDPSYDPVNSTTINHNNTKFINDNNKNDTNNVFVYNNPSFITPSFHVKKHKYDIYTSSDTFLFVIKVHNNQFNNITINNKKVLSEYNIMTLKESPDDQFYDDCIYIWKRLQENNNTDENTKKLKDEKYGRNRYKMDNHYNRSYNKNYSNDNNYNIETLNNNNNNNNKNNAKNRFYYNRKNIPYHFFNNIYEDDFFHHYNNQKNRNPVNIKKKLWYEFFFLSSSQKKKTKIYNHNEIKKVLYPIKNMFLLQYTYEEIYDAIEDDNNEKKEKKQKKKQLSVVHYYFYVHKIPKNILVNNEYFIIFLINANCRHQNNICYLEKNKQSYIQIIFKKEKGQENNYLFLSTNLLMPQENNNNNITYLNNSNNTMNPLVTLFINNQEIAKNTLYKINEIGKEKEIINIKILNNTEKNKHTLKNKTNIILDTNLIIVREYVFYKLLLKILSYFSYFYIFFLSCLQPVQMMNPIQMIQILTFININYSFPSLFSYFIKNMQSLSFISHFIYDLKIYRKKINMLQKNEDVQSYIIFDDPHEETQHTTNTNNIKKHAGKNSSDGYNYNIEQDTLKKTVNNFVHNNNNKYVPGNIHKENNINENIQNVENAQNIHYVEKDENIRDIHNDNNSNNTNDILNNSSSRNNVAWYNKNYLQYLFSLNNKKEQPENNQMTYKKLEGLKKYFINNIKNIYISKKKKKKKKKKRKKKENEIQDMKLLHIYISTLLNIINIIFILFIFYFISKKFISKNKYLNKLHIPFLSIQNFTLFIFDIFLYPLIFSICNIIQFENIYHIKIYFIYIDFLVLKIICLFLLVSFVILYIVLPIPFILYIHNHIVYNYNFKKFIPKYISHINGIVNYFPFKIFLKNMLYYHKYQNESQDNQQFPPSSNKVNTSHSNINNILKIDQKKMKNMLINVAKKNINFVGKSFLKQIIENFVHIQNEELKQNLLEDIDSTIRNSEYEKNKINGKYKNYDNIDTNHSNNLILLHKDQLDIYNNISLYQKKINLFKCYKKLFYILEEQYDQCDHYDQHNIEDIQSIRTDIPQRVIKYNKNDSKKLKKYNTFVNPPNIYNNCNDDIINIYTTSEINNSFYTYDYSIDYDIKKNKYIKVRIERNMLYNNKNKEQTMLFFLNVLNNINVGYTYDKIRLFKNNIYIKKKINLKQLYILLANKKFIELFINIEQAYDNNLQNYSFLIHNLFNENMYTLVLIRFIIVVFVIYINLCISHINIYLLSLSLLFLCIFIYRLYYISINEHLFKKCDIRKEDLLTINDQHQNDNQFIDTYKTKEQIDHSIKTSINQKMNNHSTQTEIYQKENKYGKREKQKKNDENNKYNNDFEKISNKQHNNVQTSTSSYQQSDIIEDNKNSRNKKLYNSKKQNKNIIKIYNFIESIFFQLFTIYVIIKNLKEKQHYSELILSMILFLVFIFYMFNEKNKYECIPFHLLLILLTILLYIDFLVIKQIGKEIYLYIKHILMIHIYSNYYIKINIINHMKTLQHIFHIFIYNPIKSIVKKEKDEKKNLKKTNTYTNMIRTNNNICSIFYHNNNHNKKKKYKLKQPYTNISTLKNITSNHIEIFQYEGCLHYECQVIKTEKNNIIFNNKKNKLYKNLYCYYTTTDIIKRLLKIDTIPIYLNDEMKKEQKRCICTIQVINGEHDSITKGISFFMKKKKRNNHKLYTLYYNKKYNIFITKVESSSKEQKYRNIQNNHVNEKKDRNEIYNQMNGTYITSKKNNDNYQNHMDNINSYNKEYKIIKIDKYSYTTINENNLIINSLFIKPNKIYKLQIIFKDKSLNNITFDNIKNESKSFIKKEDIINIKQKECTNKENTKYYNNVEDDNEKYNNMNTYILNKNNLNQGHYNIYTVICKEIGKLIFPYDMNYIDIFEDIKVENKNKEIIYVNIHSNHICFIKKDNIIILHHPSFEKYEIYHVYLKNNKKNISDYVSNEFEIKSTQSGQIILSIYKDVQNNDDIIYEQKNNIEGTKENPKIMFDDNIYIYKIVNYKKTKDIFVKVQKKYNTFFSPMLDNYDEKNMEQNKFDLSIFKTCINNMEKIDEQENKIDNTNNEFNDRYKNENIVDMVKPYDDFCKEIEYNYFIPIQILYKVKSRYCISLIKDLQHYFINCLNGNIGNDNNNYDNNYNNNHDNNYDNNYNKHKRKEKKKTYHDIEYNILNNNHENVSTKEEPNILSDEKNNERKVKDPNYSNYELLQNSDKSEDSQKQSNENIIRRKKNIRNHNLFLKKDQLIKYSYRIFKKISNIFPMRNKIQTHQNYGSHKMYSYEKKKKREVFFRYVPDYKKAINIYATSIQVYESKYHFLVSNKGNVKLLSNFLIENLNISYIITLFNKYSLLHNQHDEINVNLDNIHFNIYEIYKKCSDDKKRLLSKIISYLEQLVAYKFLCIIKYYGEKLNYLLLLDQINNDGDIYDIQRKIDYLFFNKYNFIKKEIKKNYKMKNCRNKNELNIHSEKQCIDISFNNIKYTYENIVKKYVKQKKYMNKCFSDIKHNIYQIRKKYPTIYNYPYFPFFINKSNIIKIKYDIDQQIHYWNNCLTNFFNNIIEKSLTHINLKYNIRIMNNHILNHIKDSLLIRTKYKHIKNYNFAHIIISHHFLNPQDIHFFPIPPIFFFMKILPSNCIFFPNNKYNSIYNKENIEQTNKNNETHIIKNNDHIIDQSQNDKSFSTSNPCNNNNMNENIPCTKLIPCYIQIINSDLLLYIFDNHNNKMCWKLGKKDYNIYEQSENYNEVTNSQCNEDQIKDVHTDERHNNIQHNMNNTMQYNPCVNVNNNHFLYDKRKDTQEDQDNNYIQTYSYDKDTSSIHSLKNKRKKDKSNNFCKDEYCTLLHDNHLNNNKLNKNLFCFTKNMNHHFSNIYNIIKNYIKNKYALFLYICNAKSIDKYNYETAPEFVNIFIQINYTCEERLRNNLTINDHLIVNINKKKQRFLDKGIEEILLETYEILKNEREDYNIMKENKNVLIDIIPNYTNNINEVQENSYTNKSIKKKKNKYIKNIYMNNLCYKNENSISNPDNNIYYNTDIVRTNDTNNNYCYNIELFTYNFFKQKVTELIKYHYNYICMSEQNYVEKYAQFEKTIRRTEDEDDHISVTTMENISMISTDIMDEYTVEYTDQHIGKYDNLYDDKEIDDVSSIIQTFHLNENPKQYDYLLKKIERSRCSNLFNIEHDIYDYNKCIHRELIFYNRSHETFSKYIGDMKNMLYNGKGKLYDKFNSLIYDGEWRNCEKNGKGKLLFKYFNIWYLYEGNFCNDEIVDKGIISLIDKEYVKNIECKKINKLCPLLIKANFSNDVSKNIKNNVANNVVNNLTNNIDKKKGKKKFTKKIMNKIQNTVMANYSYTNNVDCWSKDIIDIYMPYLKKWNIYSFYCSSNMENINKRKDIFSNNNSKNNDNYNFKHLIGYPSFELVDGDTTENKLECYKLENDTNLAKTHINDELGENKKQIKENYEIYNHVLNSGISSIIQKDTNNNDHMDNIDKITTTKKKTFLGNDKCNMNVHIVYEKNLLQDEFIDSMKNINEDKLYYPIINKCIGLTKIIYADKSEYFGAVNDRGQPNTNEKYPKAFFNNEYFFYEGEMKNFLPNGYGIFKNKEKDKNTYIGYWSNGYRQGNGCLHLKNKKYIIQGRFYKDEIKDHINIYIRDDKISKLHLSSKRNKNCQKMKIYFKNGYIFYGYFTPDFKRHGIGILIDNHNKILYHGYYENDIIDKFCYILRHKDNTIYSGNLNKGLKQGFGKLFYEPKINILDNQKQININPSNEHSIARKLETHDSIDINSNIHINFNIPSNNVVYIGYWDHNNYSHFGSCNLKNGIYKGDIKHSKKEGLGIYIYKKNKTCKHKNRYILSYFKNDKIDKMGKYYTEYDKLKVYPFDKEQIIPPLNSYEKCLKKGNTIPPHILKTDNLFINQELDSYITLPLAHMVQTIMNEIFDKSTSFINYLNASFKFDLNYFLKK